MAKLYSSIAAISPTAARAACVVARASKPPRARRAAPKTRQMMKPAGESSGDPNSNKLTHERRNLKRDARRGFNGGGNRQKRFQYGPRQFDLVTSTPPRRGLAIEFIVDRPGRTIVHHSDCEVSPNARRRVIDPSQTEINDPDSWRRRVVITDTIRVIPMSATAVFAAVDDFSGLEPSARGHFLGAAGGFRGP